jgi:hypothetical protein
VSGGAFVIQGVAMRRTGVVRAVDGRQWRSGPDGE